MVCSIKDYKDLNFMAVEKMEGSLLAHKEKMKRRKESLQNNFLKLIYPSKDLKVRKVTKEMDNVEVVEAVQEEEVIPINSTMKISYQSFRGRGQEDVEDMEPIEVQME